MSNDASLAGPGRDGQLDDLEQTHFDLLVIGGGITGAGVAREAALRGLSVALVEANDFASGTSSRSSKLIHGGLRYLAMGDIALVRETALERKRVHRLAPHLAEPKWMLAPARSRAGLMKFRTAITTYEKLGAVEDKDRHRNWQGDELRENEPTLNQERYPYACAYREYLTDDVRLVLANLRAATRSGACAVNHLAVTEIVHKAGRAVGATANCALTGRSLTIKSRTVVNAAGPWVEGIMALDETRDADAAPRLHLSRGVHIVMDRSRLPVRNLVIMGTEDRRSIFAISRDDSVYVGTTDTSYPSGATVWPEITPEDVEYLLKPVAKTFKTDPLGPQDVIAAWSGLRPLIAKPGKQAKEISRKDEIWVGHSGLITIAGGKLTGYRKMATTVVERVLSLASDLKARPTLDEDHDEPLPGGDFSGDLANLAGTLSRETGLDEKYADRIVRLYGDESSSVVALGRDPVIDGGTVLLGEVAWAVEQEAAASLEDVIYRRTRAALYCGRECDGLLEPIARALQARLGWNDEECQSQIDSVRGQMTGDLAFKHVS